MLHGHIVKSFDGRWHRQGRVLDIAPAGPLLGPCYRGTIPEWTESIGERDRRRAAQGQRLAHGAFGTIVLVRWPDGSEAWQSVTTLSLDGARA